MAPFWGPAQSRPLQVHPEDQLRARPSRSVLNRTHTCRQVVFRGDDPVLIPNQ